MKWNRESFIDFLAFSAAYGSKKGEPKYSEKFDLNNDGQIGFPDFFIFSRYYGK